MASRGSGAAKGRGTSGPGSRPPSARKESGTSRSGATGKSSTGKSSTGKSSTGKSSTGKSSTGGSRAAKSTTGSKAAKASHEQGSGLWRWGVIALVGLVLVVLLAPTMRSYFSQRGEIAALERQVAQGEERLGQLEAEQERWRDPAYIEQQARERLKFVRPGEVSYTVIGGDEVEGPQVATGQVSETRPWYDRVWASIGQADRTDAEPAP